MTQDFVNSVTDAQKQLHADMRRDTDMRWSLLPVEPIQTSRREWWAVAAFCAVCLGVVFLLALTMGVLS